MTSRAPRAKIRSLAKASVRPDSRMSSTSSTSRSCTSRFDVAQHIDLAGRARALAVAARIMKSTSGDRPAWCMARIRSAAKMKLPLSTGTTRRRCGLAGQRSSGQHLMRAAISASEKRTSMRYPSILWLAHDPPFKPISSAFAKRICSFAAASGGAETRVVKLVVSPGRERPCVRCPASRCKVPCQHGSDQGKAQPGHLALVIGRR